MAFEIEDFTPVKITSVNPRSERHGPEELHPAVDLHIKQALADACAAEAVH